MGSPTKIVLELKNMGNKEATTVLSYCKDLGYCCRDAKQNNHRQGRKPQGWQHFKQICCCEALRDGVKHIAGKSNLSDQFSK